ncbi:sensor histidine kinase [Paenibacillus glycanilyticus]|uniref:Two-component sensor histidine kinase n=1 Tax=Paenibacillus glycanilyticus TaxID=126569 RepID=A0ABQ6GBV8_9BACL|nr:sensor histidine kinase [Paenibacillus glycanilyticus]GLX68434.1 two-component sensor histidine kinase [Paenibacillus glycanilyticus]
MIKNLYRSYFSRKYFNKILFVYMFITIVTFCTLAYVTVNNTSDLIKEKELKYNDVVLNRIMAHLDSKYDIVKTMLKQTLIDKEFVQDIYYFLQQDYSPFNMDYIETKWVFDDYMSSALSRDRDITGISVYKIRDQRIYEYSETAVTNNLLNEYRYPDLIRHSGQSSSFSEIYPAHYPAYLSISNSFVFTVSMKLKADNLVDDAGILLVDFDTQSFQDIISSQRNDLASDFIVLTSSGEVIFDSSNRYYGKEFTSFNQIQQVTSSSTVNIDHTPTVMYKLTDPETGNMVVSLIPEKLLLSQANEIRDKILLLALACISGCMLLMYIGSKIFSQRVLRITKHLKKIGAGDLSIRLPVKNQNVDEFDEISISFNRMSEKLVDYIDRFYVLELKQKSSELKALQAQVNPHFLYNTLEAIRMKTVLSGDRESAHMIYILAKLLRSSAKEQMAVTIEEEIGFCDLYLNLFKIRYENNFDYTFEIDSDIVELGIIKHLLQPLLENYLIHGFLPKKENNHLLLRGVREGDHLLFTIEDNGSGITETKLNEINRNLEREPLPSDSIGLINVNERIQIAFGQHYGLSIKSDQATGTTVTIIIPVLTLQEVQQCTRSS